MTAFNAPGIKIFERDVSEIATPVGTSTGGLVGKTNEGPVNQRILVTNDKDFFSTFGTPQSATDIVHHAANNYLQESDSLYFVRATFGDESYSNIAINTAGQLSASTSASNITATDTTTLLSVTGYEDGNTLKSGNGDPGIYDFETATALTGSGFEQSLLVGSIGPGEYGNNIGVSIITCASSDLENVENGFNWKFQFDDATSGTPADASLSTTRWSKIYRVNVYTKPEGQDNSFWGEVSATTPVETFLVSNVNNLRDDNGASLYAPDVINSKSSYIYVKPTDGAYPKSQETILALQNGSNGTTNTAGEKQSAWTLFSDREKVSVNILLVPDEPVTTADKNTLINVGNIAASRQDCIAVGQIGTKTETRSQNLVTDFNTNYGFSNPSYVAVYAGYSRIFDRFTDKNIFLPNAIFGATIMARTDAVARTWDAPAGINRGILPVAGQLKKFNESEIGQLYDANINSIKFINGFGNVMWGQKTAQRKATALDRVNVRRLLLYIEGSVEPALLPFMFEGNTDKLRSRVFSVVDGFMSTVLAGGGVTKYQVVCDETNNTPQTIDSNQLNVDLYLQPTKTVEAIQVQVIITRSGVDFGEVII